jgi:5-methylcytosine-specific restriction endonuclease McrA
MAGPESVLAVDEKREKQRLRMAKWRAENPERSKQNNQRWAKENPEKRKESVRKWREKNKERHVQYQKKYQSENLDIFRIHAQNRRQKLREGRLSSDIYKRLIILQRSKCACCKADLSKVKAHLDHIVPLALGGEHLDSNIQLLCQPCNQQKHAKHPVEFMQSKGMLI